MNYTVNSNLTLTSVLKTPAHISALFSILGKRESQHTISHNQHTNFNTHRDFVLSHPYRYWFLVEWKEKFVGTIYLTNENVIGAFVERTYLGILEETLAYVLDRFEPLPGIPSVRNSAFTINVAPRNTAYAEIIRRLGGHLLQETYSLSKTIES